MNTIDEAIEVLQAIKDGKDTQFKSAGSWIGRPYSNIPDFYKYEYRVKPEPMELWVNFYGCDAYPHLTRELAESYSTGDCITKHFKEVV